MDEIIDDAERERQRETERERSFIERYLLKLIDDTARAVSERLCHMRRRIHVSYEEDDTCVISFVHCFWVLRVTR